MLSVLDLFKRNLQFSSNSAKVVVVMISSHLGEEEIQESPFSPDMKVAILLVPVELLDPVHNASPPL